MFGPHTRQDSGTNPEEETDSNCLRARMNQIEPPRGRILAVDRSFKSLRRSLTDLEGWNFPRRGSEGKQESRCPSEYGSLDAPMTRVRI